jgi:hypothetical protein
MNEIMPNRWDTGTLNGWEEDGRTTEEDYCLTGTGLKAYIDVVDDDGDYGYLYGVFHFMACCVC